MKTHRMWIEIVATAAAIAFALALLLASIGAAAGAAADDLGAQQAVPGTSTQHVFEGMVTCSRCRAKHLPSLAQTADTCVRVCVHGGAKFALVNADSFYLLDGDLSALKKIAGQRARVVGNLNGNTIEVESVTAGT